MTDNYVAQQEEAMAYERLVATLNLLSELGADVETLVLDALQDVTGVNTDAWH